MSSPIGHTLMGCAVAMAPIPSGMPRAWEVWAVCLISANLPDLDCSPRLLAGNPRGGHASSGLSLLAYMPHAPPARRLE
jgi:hypothetical protein